jgi:hypothetical protein
MKNDTSLKGKEFLILQNIITLQSFFIWHSTHSKKHALRKGRDR